MDVEQIQKINSLALELMKQGLATDREDAINQAQKIYKEQDSRGYSQMRNTMGQVHGTPEPAQGSSMGGHSELGQDKIKEILEQNTKYIVKTLKEFNEKVNVLEKEMEALKIKMNYNRLPTVKELTTNSVPEPVAAPRPTEQPQQPEKPASHPRSGGYNENDVSIEKFFYMGNR
ncbi:hypothetical protein COV20_02195 [Candidatus Woesearchaeota archaeon CG10_big_fil_rev_8_21_14_0_10_45_16]|nr:MAG: hypothetical protein COV20_02195 [Candidatus Woesearchaeota archaeon CG10_big_fil_rev_8_21_14_0_10_45_16]